jgi:hypothetical protein
MRLKKRKEEKNDFPISERWKIGDRILDPTNQGKDVVCFIIKCGYL